MNLILKLKLIFAGYTSSKNQVRTRQKIKFVSKSIFFRVCNKLPNWHFKNQAQIDTANDLKRFGIIVELQISLIEVKFKSIVLVKDRNLCHFLFLFFLIYVSLFLDQGGNKLGMSQFLCACGYWIYTTLFHPRFSGSTSHRNAPFERAAFQKEFVTKA